MTLHNQTQKRKRIEIIDLVSDQSEVDDDSGLDDPPRTKQKTIAELDTNGIRPFTGASKLRIPAPSSVLRGPRESQPTSGGVLRGSSRDVSDPHALAFQQHSQAERTAWLSQTSPANGEDVDLDEIVSSQVALDNDQLQLYGCLDTKIVGTQYYRGLATSGEYILMRREPGNPYDSNAIRIDNVQGQQIGHIPKRIAQKLAVYMDRGWMCFEGRLAGTIGQYDCPLVVQVCW